MSVETVVVKRGATVAEKPAQSSDIFPAILTAPDCLSALVTPEKSASVEKGTTVGVSQDTAPTQKPEQKAVETGPPITTKEFLTSYGFLGVKSLGAAAIYGLGMLNGWQYSGAFIAGAVTCWAVEGAITPFLGHKSWNPIQLAYSGVSKLAEGLKYMVGKTLDSDAGHLLMKGDGFALRLGVASVLASGAWLTGNPIVVGVSGAIAYRAVRRLFA